MSDAPDVIDRARSAINGAARDGDRTQARNTVEGEQPSTAMYLGNHGGLAARIAAYGDAGVDRMILTVPRPWDPDAMRRLAAAAGVRSTGSPPPRPAP